MELQLDAVLKNYKSKQVLKGITLTMGTGVYGLLGPNGAGKTTMIRMLADVLRPTKGRILYDGKDIRDLGDAYRAKIGYLPQDVSFYGDFTGRDYLEYSAALKGMEKARAKRRIEELARSVGLWEDLKRNCTAYSGGMQRRLGIAQALLDDPEILILDEPTSGLDPHERIKFRNIISAYAKDRLVLLSTHIVSDVEQIAAQIMMMEHGHIRHIHTGGEYVHMMEGRVWLVEMPADRLVDFQNQAVISNVRAKDGCMEVRIIEEAWERQRQFVADASHELKTPLAVISANADALLLESQDSPGSSRKWLGYIRDEISRMSGLINDLLLLAKVEGNTRTESRIQFDLGQCIAEACVVVEALLYEKGIALESSIPEHVILDSSEDDIRRLISILLDNAVKYTNPGGSIRVCLKKQKGIAELSIENSGPGIPAQMLPYIFDRFYRADQARENEDGSYGLGLSIAKGISGRLGAELTAQSVPGQSTTFTFRIRTGC